MKPSMRENPLVDHSTLLSVQRIRLAIFNSGLPPWARWVERALELLEEDIAGTLRKESPGPPISRGEEPKE